jgi:hypothetical protein
VPSSEPTDRQVRADVYRITRVYLEVERGLRPPEQLEKFLTPAEYRRHRSRPQHPAARDREPVLPTDVGRIHLDRHLPGQITATIPTRETGEHWGALVLHFVRNHAGRWRIDQLERLTRPTVARDTPKTPPEPKDLDTRVRVIEEERRLVDAAHRATTTRVRELREAGADRDQTRELRTQQKTWKRLRSELDTELATLRHIRELRHALADIDLRHDRHPTELDDQQLDVLLGPVPDHKWRRGLRDGVIDEIHTYRRRWNVTDPRNVLGPTPDDPDHQHDRDELARTLRAAARALGTNRNGTAREPDPRRRQRPQIQPRGIAAER